MMTQPTIDKLRALKLFALANALQHQLARVKAARGGFRGDGDRHSPIDDGGRAISLGLISSHYFKHV